MTMHRAAIDNGGVRSLRERNQHNLLATEYERLAKAKTDEYIEHCRNGTQQEETASMRSAIRTLLGQVSDYHAQARHSQYQAQLAVKQALPYIRNRVGETPPRWRHQTWVRRWDTDLLIQRMNLTKHWGDQFSQLLKDEDGDGFVHMLNGMRGSGGLSDQVVSKLKDIWETATSDTICTCDRCGNIGREDDDEWHTVMDYDHNENKWCGSCTDDEATYSDEMGEYIEDSCKVALYTDTDSFDNDQPDGYATERWVQRRSNDWHRVYHPDSGGVCYVDDEVYSYWEDEYGEVNLPGYHHGNRIGYIPTTFMQRKHKVFMGVEIELEFGHGEERNRNRCIKALRKAGFERDYMTMEYDGSLSVGFECVTGYTGLDVHRERIPDLLRIAREYDANDHDERTGLHVHVSRDEMTPWQMAKLAALIYNPDNRDWIETLAGREFGEYREDIDYATQISYMGSRAKEVREWNYESKATRLNYVKDGMGAGDLTRYAALSFNPSTGRQTVEFRMFQGTTKSNVVLAYIEFAYAAWHFARQGSLQEMNSKQFAKFICRPDNRGDTTFLRKYMRQFDQDVVAEDNKYVSKKQRAQATV